MKSVAVLTKTCFAQGVRSVPGFLHNQFAAQIGDLQKKRTLLPLADNQKSVTSRSHTVGNHACQDHGRRSTNGEGHIGLQRSKKRLISVWGRAV